MTDAMSGIEGVNSDQGLQIPRMFWVFATQV